MSVESRSPRSVWVEIVIFKMPKYLLYRHAPHGACELKSCTIALHTFYCIVTLPTERVSWNWTVFFRCYRSLGHAPHGACELKLIVSIWGSLVAPSRSPRSVWVEITRSRPKILSTSSRSPRSVWVEIYEMPVIRPPETGHAPHGACELKYGTVYSSLKQYGVTLPTERVSWNRTKDPCTELAESHAPRGACELKCII